MTPSLHGGVKRAQIWTSLLFTVPTAAFWPGWVWSKWLYKLCSQSKQLEVQHFHAASSGTSMPYLLHGVKFAGRDFCIRDCTEPTFPRCVPSTSAGGSISRLSCEPTASRARANTGTPRTWRREGLLGQPNSTARGTLAI